ncbi:MAG: preprotein translocase subunit SecE [Phycisphaerae bacterium]|nr:preprotein translocase subunit SecE [Phycisphaerae bacterium]MDD5381085.1 preprotein translocase subunit SecE [Phycisphaerae bacterium]
MIFGIYKRGQAKYTRLGSAFGFGLVAAVGCLLLYQKLDGADMGLWVSTMVPVGIAAGFAVLIFWLSNKSSIADFLIAAEGEMKKVSWSSRKEIAVSTFIVIVLVIIMAVFLGSADLGFKLFFTEVFGL